MSSSFPQTSKPVLSTSSFIPLLPPFPQQFRRNAKFAAQGTQKAVAAAKKAAASA
jgi:hypothetical protein